jgi:phosphonoacetaldehyde hydrolase
MNLKAVIFDWAGTTVDFGSLCPIGAFKSAFAARGVSVQADDIHKFMGMRKRDHIQAVLGLPEVSNRWLSVNQKAPTSNDIESLYDQAENLIVDTISQYSTPTPHLLEAIQTARSRGLKVGSTSGYTVRMMERLAASARRKGYSPDVWVASDQVPQGRPMPWMIFKNMEELGVCPPCTVVKVGDTLQDVAEGINAGVWSVAVVESSSMVGKSMAELAAMPLKIKDVLFRKVRKQYAEAGAHFIIKNLSELGDVLDWVESRLEKGMMPPRIRRRVSQLSINFLL